MAAARDTEVVNSSATLFNAAGDAVDTAITFSGANRAAAVVVTWNGSGGHTLADNAVTIVGGDTFVPFGATISQGALRKRAYYLVAPPTGAQMVRVDPSTGTGDTPGRIEVLSRIGVHQTTPTSGYNPAQGTADDPWNTIAVTITSETDDLVDVSHGLLGTGVSFTSATGFTARLSGVASTTVGSACGEAAGAASVVTSSDWNCSFGTANWIALGWNWNAAGGAAGLVDEDYVTPGVVVQGHPDVVMHF